MPKEALDGLALGCLAQRKLHVFKASLGSIWMHIARRQDSRTACVPCAWSRISDSVDANHGPSETGHLRQGSVLDKNLCGRVVAAPLAHLALNHSIVRSVSKSVGNEGTFVIVF